MTEEEKIQYLVDKLKRKNFSDMGDRALWIFCSNIVRRINQEKNENKVEGVFIGNVLKDTNILNVKDIGKYFSSKFSIKFKVPYGKISGKEYGLLKKLVDTYTPSGVVKMIDFLMNNYRVIKVDSPSIPVLYGFRRSIISKIGFIMNDRINQEEEDSDSIRF